MSLVYLGLPPKANQSVAPGLASKDIHLQRAAPSTLAPVVTVNDVQPLHAVFSKFLNVYISSAINQSSLPLSQPYGPINHKKVPAFARSPTIVWSYGTKLSTEAIDHIKSRHGAEETMIKGKPGFLATLNHEQVVALLSDATPPIETTPSNNTCMNIRGYKAYVGLLRFYDAVMRVNQYPYVKRENDDVEDDNRAHERISAGFEIVEGVTEKDGESMTVNLLPRHVKAFANTAVKFDEFEYTVKGPVDLPAATDGMLFPYVAELALPDRETITTFLYNHLFYAFGADADDAQAAFLEFKSNWGSVAGTTWEGELSHAFFVLEVALQAQSTVRVMVDNAGRYQGSIILGGEFTVSLPGGSYTPISSADLKATLPRATPHLSALTNIFNAIGFPTMEERIQKREACKSIHDIRAAIVRSAVVEMRLQDVRDALHLVSFPNDKAYLAPTAHNISTIFEAMTDLSTNERQFPIYPPMVIEADRRLRLLSAFGPTAPSFRVPGGKEMKLDVAFTATRRGAGGKQETVAVSKVACILKPVRDAYNDLQTVFTSRAILNPYGSTVVNRISSQSLLRTFESDSAKMILESLRAVSGITGLMVAGSSQSSKRKADEADDGSKKKLRVFEL